MLLLNKSKQTNQNSVSSVNEENFQRQSSQEVIEKEEDESTEVFRPTKS